MKLSICYIGLGGNLGDVERAFAAALRSLADRGCQVHAVSSLYCTRPMGPQAGRPFLNACAQIKTTSPSEPLLNTLQEIERNAGRRPGARWSERTLDLDLLLYGDRLSETPHLRLPHPGVLYRRFVLDPLFEIAPQLVVPGCGRTVGALRDRLLKRPLPIRLVGGSIAERARLAKLLIAGDGRLRVLDESDPDVAGDVTLLRLDRRAVNVSREAGSADPNVIEIDVAVGLDSAESAVCAIVDAMLDEPRGIGPLQWR